MKTVGKRINPAFTVVQPLPAWPVWPAPKLDLTCGDRHAKVLSVAPSAPVVSAVPAATRPTNISPAATAN